jgi:hypothetical protein
VVAGRAPGSATYAPLSVKGRSDKPRGFIRSRALWSAGTRAHIPVALRSAERSFSLETRALNVSPYVSLRPGILASGSAAARLDGLAVDGPSGAVQKRPTTGSMSPAGPWPGPHSASATSPGSWISRAANIAASVAVRHRSCPCGRPA